MTSYSSNLVKKTKDLKLKDDQFINILLLGETGVGKSTFINSLANYLTYSDFKKAEKETLVILIPSKCEVKDKHDEYHIINIGSEEDQNECLDTGMSATQDVKSYVFPISNGNIKVRLIDTPGIGDVRGVAQDNINCENILDYIGQLHELHAICYLFKPTNPRITVYFDYCMTQILSRLDKSASKNIIFIFTNTRGTDYSPGDTFPSLQKVIDGIKAKPPHVDIPLSRKNVFCFDNEAFRYLAAIQKGVAFDGPTKQRNHESWKRSVQQCLSLIKYITGDAENPPLKPHFIKSTSAINEARRLVTQLSQPLADISQLINDNLFILQRHQENFDLNTDTLEELKQKLYMPVINLQVITLTQPVTVCTAKKCAEVYKVEGINKWHYKQRCHDPCFLTNVPKEVIGSPELVNCAAIDKLTKACTKCQCDFSIHMHVYYLSKTVDSKIIDSNIKQNIDNKEILLKNVRKLINDISQRKEELEKEHGIIIKTCARFAHFLQNNAITPFSDSYKEYVEYLILRERSLGAQSKMSVIRHLENLLLEYEACKQSFNEALESQKKLGETNVFITPQKIQESIQDLYKLKHNGKKIKELYECQKKSRVKEYKYKEYIHDVTSQLDDSDIKTEHKTEQQATKEQKKNKYQQKQYKKTNDGDQKSNKQPRNKSQIRHNARAPSPPPSYEDVQPTRGFRTTQEFQQQYQGNSRRPWGDCYNCPPRSNSHHQVAPCTDHYPNYHEQGYHKPGYNQPGYNQSDYRSPNYHQSNYPHPHYQSNFPRAGNNQNHFPCHDPRDVPVNGPDYRHYPNQHSNSYNPQVDTRATHPIETKNHSDRYEFKVVVNTPQTAPNVIPPLMTPQQPPPHGHPRDYVQHEFYPPRTWNSPNHDGPYQHGSRSYDSHRKQGYGPSGPTPRGNQFPARGYKDRDNGTFNRGRGGNRKEKGRRQYTQKFKSNNYHKKKDNNMGNESDSSSD